MEHDSTLTFDAPRFFRQLGLALQVVRHKSGLSLEQIRKRAGIGKSQMSKYENGKESPKLETLARILDTLEVEPIWFFYLMHQLSRERPLESLRIDLLLLRGGLGDPLSKSTGEGFLRLFASVLDLHALIAEEHSLLEGERRIPLHGGTVTPPSLLRAHEGNE
jgi:transcriptional regulator with XRE-family HTH domain